MYSEIIVVACILINVNCLLQSQQQKLPIPPQYVASRACSPNLASQPCQRLAVGSNNGLNASPRCQTLSSLLRYPSSVCPIQSIRTCPSSTVQAPSCQSNVRPVCSLSSQRDLAPSCGTVPVLQQQCLSSPTCLTSAPLLQPPCSSSISNFRSTPFISPPCLSQASTYSSVSMLPPPCFTSAPTLSSLPLISGGIGRMPNLAPIPFSAPCLPQVIPPRLAPMPTPCLSEASTYSTVPMLPPQFFTSAPTLSSLPLISDGFGRTLNLAPIPFSVPCLPQVIPPCLVPTPAPIMSRLGFPSLPCNRCAPPVSPIPPSLTNLPYSTQFTCQERLYLPGLCDVIMPLENTITPPHITDCEQENPLELPITFLPAASPVSALGVSVLPPVLPPSECKCLFLRKIPIPPPCI